VIPDLVRIAAPSTSRREATALAWDNDWVLEKMVGGENKPVEKIWLTTDERSAVHFIEDPALKLHYFAVAGDDKEEIADQIRRAVPTLTRQDLEQMADSAQESKDWVDLAYAVAASAPGTFDDELFAILRRVLDRPEPDVRRAAIYAMAYPAWLEFADVLGKVEKDDPDDEVRSFAREMREELENRYWESDSG